MWADAVDPWVFHGPVFAGEAVDRDRNTVPCSGHRDFLYDLLRWRQPRSAVELGTRCGVSLLAIAQALRDSGAESQLHAVGTWEDDEDAGFYGDDVFDTFQRSVQEIKGPDVTIHRCPCSEALSQFEDESLDLIQIDGLHTDETAEETFDAWLPKLAPNGALLIHDVDPGSGHGSADHWIQEVAARFLTVTFPHSFGLGVTFPKGTRGWDFLLSEDFGRWKDIYHQSALAHEMSLKVAEQAELIHDRDQTIAEQERAIREMEVPLARVAHLQLLEISPRRQVRALARSVPRTLRAKVRSRRALDGESKSEDVPNLVDVSATTSRSEPRQLEDLVKATMDPTWYAREHGVPESEALPDYWREGLAVGRPLSRIHAEAIARADVARSELRREVSESFEPGGRVSTPAADFDRAVRKHAPELVTVDVWDTLLMRTRPADAAKTATAARMLLLEGLDPGDHDPFSLAEIRVTVERRMAESRLDQEYELHEVLEGVLRELDHSPAPIPGVAAALVEAEIQDEATNTFVDRDLWKRLQACHVPVVLLSDFYMRGPQLERILSQAVGEPVPWPVIVSVDRHNSKRVNGRLLTEIRDQYGVVAGSHLHVGDNPHSDIQNQLSTGGKALAVEQPSAHPAAGAYRRSDLSAPMAELRRRLAVLEIDGEFACAGRDLSLLAVGLVAGAIEAARDSGSSAVHYLSREGLFLAKVHEIVEPILRRGVSTEIRPVHLTASRLSTFGAALQVPYFASLHRMWSMYGQQSMRAMLTSIGLDAETFSESLAAVNLAVDDAVNEPSGDQRIRDFLELPEVEEVIAAHVQQSRDLLREYVESRTSLEGTFVAVDIGWRGTIQDNIVRALGIQRSIGVYFGLFPYLNPQPFGVTKTAVAFDGNTGEDFAFAEPPAVLERPWTPDVRSTIGYEQSPAGVVPTLRERGDPAAAGVPEFQNASLRSASTVASWMVSHGLTTANLRAELHEAARALWEQPPSAIADIWFDSDHDETFGVLNVTSFGKSRPSEAWRTGPLSQHVEEGIRSSGWAAGYLRWRPISAVQALSEAVDGSLPEAVDG